MIRRRINFLGLRVLQVAMVSGCVMGLLAGCSSRLQTTIVSGSEGQKLQGAQAEPKSVVVEEVTVQPIQEVSIPAVPAMDIPVEEPARPVIRRELGSEIFATPRTPDVPSEISSRFEPSPTPVPPTSEPAIQSSAVEIPAIAFESELPARPTLRDDQTSPVQVAKVMPQEPEKVAIATETLKKALSDIYFDYDHFSIREDAKSVLKSNARLLSATLAEKTIVIEGHCDERGTQSYNMVLGEARANAVKTFLEDLGISGDKLQVVSYGKDKPFCMEQTEECWQENRRGHFVIK
jgi:peptidoglycan-associated lipoprotein